MEADKVAQMREKLKQKGAKDPTALARYIARQSYGSKAHKRMCKKAAPEPELTDDEIEDILLSITPAEWADVEKKEAKLGTGARFKKLKGKLAAEGAEDPGALAAYIGRKKYGKAKFQGLAAKKKRK